MTPFDLAGDAGMSAKQLSALETGRSAPAQAELLRLASCLDVPLRGRNALLRAAGFAPVFQERGFGAPELVTVRRDIDVLLAALDPNPALLIDWRWTLLAANPGVAQMVAGAEAMLLRPPVNVLRLLLHPAGLAPRIINLRQWRGHLIARLRRQIALSDDSVLIDLLDELHRFPDPAGAEPASASDPDAGIAVPLRLATIGGVLSFFSTTTRFAVPADVTVADLSVEAFLPADSATARAIRVSAWQNEEPPEPPSASTRRPADALI